ncbi:MAG TPA: FecR domain-containing protein [Polyangia bacterium]|nr:FecR domain-containing protein [Polyangia bacterium]
MSDPRWLDDSDKPAHRVLRQALDEAPRWSRSEVRQRRLWTRLADAANSVRAMRRAFRTGALAASLLTVVFVGAIEVAHWQMSGDDTAAQAEGPVKAAPATAAGANAEPTTAAATPVAPAGEIIETGARERRIRELPQDAHAEVFASSVLALDDTGHPSVRKGQVRFHVAHQPPGQRFTVSFSGYVALVVGTRFVISVHDGNRAGLTVEEGTVEIWRGGARVARVARGQSWSSGDPGAVQAVARPRPRGARAAAVASAVPTAEPALLAARAESDPRRALALYGALAQGDGPSAENALYEMGAIYQDRLAQPREALATWERYRTRFPSGLLRIETDLSIVDALADLGQNGRALAEATAFLKRYPDTERRAEMARVAGDLSRTSGNCPSAIGYYDMVLGAGGAQSGDADDAAFGRAACLYTQGEPTADAALRGYLRRHPRGRHVVEARRLAPELPAATPPP